MVSQSSSVGYTIMEDCWLDSCPKDDHWHLAQGGQDTKGNCKEAGCSQSSVPKHIDREAKGRKRCGRKKCTSNRDNRTLERIVKQNPFKNVGEIHKEWTAAGSVLQEPLRTDVCKTWVSAVAFLVSSHSWTTDSVRSVSPGLKTKRTGLLLSCPKLCSLMKVNFAFPLEIRVPESGGREERHRIHVAWGPCKVSTVSDGLGCHVICWCWSTVFSEVRGQHNRIPWSLEHFMLPAADQLYGDADSFSNRTWHLHTVPKLPVPGLRTMVSCS